MIHKIRAIDRTHSLYQGLEGTRAVTSSHPIIMESCCRLPFFATSDRLPAPLPTIETITGSEDVLQEYSGRRIVRVGTYFIVKYGAGVCLTEGENMLFIKQVSTIQVPNVYALYSRRIDGDKLPTNYIVMENIAGENLASRWVSLDTPAKLAIADQLRNYFTQLRRISSPGYFGLLGKRPFVDSVFWAGPDAYQRVISGPFDTEQQMVNALVQKYLHSNPGLQKSEYYSRVLPAEERSH